MFVLFKKFFGKRGGFTLIEAVAVLGVLAVITAILLINNRLSEQQLSLSKDAAGMANAVSRAKSLTLQNLDESGCGYGVHFVPTTDINQDSYIIFKDKNCNYKYDADENIAGQESVSKLDTGLRFVTTTASPNPVFIKDVIFYSSDAKVKLTGLKDENISPAGIVIIKTESTPASYMTLKITVSGQITSKSGYYSTPDAFDSGNEDLENGTVQKGTEEGEGSKIKEEDLITCIPDSCVGKTCADYNGCGTPCVVCSFGQYCINKQCITCTPSCSGKVCGDSNGCGGVCTYCPTGQTCSGQSDGSYKCISAGVELRLNSIDPPIGTK